MHPQIRHFVPAHPNASFAVQHPAPVKIQIHATMGIFAIAHQHTRSVKRLIDDLPITGFHARFVQICHRVAQRCQRQVNAEKTRLHIPQQPPAIETAVFTVAILTVAIRCNVVLHIFTLNRQDLGNVFEGSWYLGILH